jgi:outer membrane usher protein
MTRPSRRRALRGAVRALLATCIVLCAAPARADPEQLAILTLVVNEAKKQEVTVLLRDGDVWLTPAELERAGVHAAGGTRRTFDGTTYLSLGSLSPKLRHAVDEETLTLRLTADSALLGTTVIDLAGSPPPDLEHRADLMAFLNYAPRLTDMRRVDAFFEAGLSFQGILLFSSASASEEHGVVRGLTNLTIDDRPAMRRWIVGDTFANGGELGGGMFTAGLTVEKNFGLDPYFVRHPALGATGTVLVPSTVDVYVNGVLVRSERVEPGGFRLDNLPVTAGTSGVSSYVIRDIYGRQQTVASSFYTAATLLAPGLSDYSYTVGVERRDVATESLSYGEPGFLGRHRIGLTNAVTGGVRVEAAPDLVSAGPTVALALPIGAIDLGAAGSAHARGGGYGAYAAYSVSSSWFGAGAGARWVSDRYVTLSLSPEDDRATLDASGYISVPLGRRVSISTQVGVTDPRDLGARVRIAETVGVMVDRRIYLLVTGSRTAHGLEVDTDVLATLSYSFDAVSASLGHHVTDDDYEATAQVSKPLPRGAGAGYRVSAVLSDAARAQAVGQAQWQHGRYEATVDVDQHGQHVTVGAAGGIVAVQGAGVFVTRPVQDALAVVRVPNAPGVRVYADNQEVGRTNEGGDLLIADLLPYYGNRLRIADQDLPLDYSVTAVERVIAPPQRGAAVVAFQARRASFARGTVVVQDGDQRVVPSFGELQVTIGAEVVTSPLGRGGEFELEDVDAGRHHAVVVHAGGRCSFTLSVPESTGAIVAAGLQRCVQRRPAPPPARGRPRAPAASAGQP